jgi:hypothetical protein
MTLSNNKDRLRYRLRKHTFVETLDEKLPFLILNDPMAEIYACYKFMGEVLAGEYAFSLLAADGKQRAAYYDKVNSVVPRLPSYSELYVPGFVYHPLINFFLVEYRKHPISQLSGGERAARVLANGMTVAELFIDFVRALLSEAATQGLRKKIADADAKLKKNKKSQVKFQKELFRRCSRPVILRGDGCYRKALFTPDDLKGFIKQEAQDRFDHSSLYASGVELEGRALPAMKVSFEEVQQDRVKLFANMKGKPSLFRHLIGYVWRIEYAHKAGFHLHLLLAFGGARVRKHEWLADRIGDYWEDDITKGRGRFHNCNSSWDKDDVRYGLGAIEWHDDRLRGNLENHVLPYLSKPDQYVLVRPYKGCKLTGCGFVHRAKPTRRGRPRSPGLQRPQPPTP